MFRVVCVRVSLSSVPMSVSGSVCPCPCLCLCLCPDSLEADERVSVGERLLGSAKKLEVKAKALQQEHLVTHVISGKLVVSKEALELMKHEARRIAKQV